LENCKNEEDAKSFCDYAGHWTEIDCWQIAYEPNHVMAKYKYEKIDTL